MLTSIVTTFFWGDLYRELCNVACVAAEREGEGNGTGGGGRGGRGKRREKGKGAPTTKAHIVGYSGLLTATKFWLESNHILKYSSCVNIVMQKSTCFSANLWSVVCWQLTFVGEYPTREGPFAPLCRLHVMCSLPHILQMSILWCLLQHYLGNCWGS